MTSQTPRHSLNKPGAGDAVDVVTQLDANFDSLDNALYTSDAVAGDLTGTASAPTVAAIQGVDLWCPRRRAGHHGDVDCGGSVGGPGRRRFVGR